MKDYTLAELTILRDEIAMRIPEEPNTLDLLFYGVSGASEKLKEARLEWKTKYERERDVLDQVKIRINEIVTKFIEEK